jgi:threonine/homoserine/homoserine lactone efflux protein
MTTLISFALVALLMAVTPGPNMMYYVSRSICQGQIAGLISLAGVVVGLSIYMLAAAFGITALVFTIPHAYDGIRFAGAIYLLWLAWSAVKPNGSSPFQPRKLPHDPPAKLFRMGLITVVLNPKVAMIYLSLLPQFIDPHRGSPLTQSLILGLTQVVIAGTSSGLIAMSAGTVAKFLAENQTWLLAQRWFMGLVLGGIAAHMVLAG